LEEIKYLDWKSDVSEEENFQIASSRKSKKQEKNKKKRSIRGKSGHPLDESTSPVRGVPRSRSRYNLRKGAAWDKNS
jgi:hypothetical protein